MAFRPLQDALLWMGLGQLLNVSLPFFPRDNSIISYSSQEEFIGRCTSFAAEASTPKATVYFSNYVPAGTTISLTDNDPSCGVTEWKVSTDICRVGMSVATSGTSEMIVEGWLPFDYTGRFLTTTNRGLGGCILYNELEYTSSLGFASVGMNTGYNGSTAAPMLNNPNAIEDYAYRSVHTGTVAGKELAKQFYGVPSRKSYYLGCSSGGRQGFKEAQDFPEDFDGILAGAPALALTRIVSWGAYLTNTVGAPDSETYITPDQWALVYDELLRQCDKLDGSVDGLLEDPDMCQFTPEVLICKKDQKSGCLTPKQAEVVNKIHSPFYGLNGELLYPRMQPGVNMKRQKFYVDGNPSALAEDWFRDVVYNDTTWNGRSFTLQDAAVALAQNPFNVETWNGDLSGLANRGGKLLTYHGLQDYVVSSEISQLYYAHVARTMGLPPSELDEFYRLFFVSGMDHCRDGDGAWAIGQDPTAVAGKDASENALMALVKWVEEGVAPEVLRGAKLAEDGVTAEYWRAHCKWPKKNRYIGPGLATEEGSWVCE
ncbi:feruloyl [Moniliophthora roreri MCA 2997]|uniref:Carboxylic ester hydrolase n=2 Tax=Moniliophthora roreri TaxID=221103 RepID=V2WF86_MONRO|nr:feruloyl [Moniliophthora roreri MCA 2997]KAI3602369.1 feruloyl [Moniliophthora roreri]